MIRMLAAFDDTFVNSGLFGEAMRYDIQPPRRKRTHTEGSRTTLGK